MLYSETIAVCSEIHTKHINTLCGQNVEFLNVKRGGTYSNHWALKFLQCQERERSEGHAGMGQFLARMLRRFSVMLIKLRSADTSVT
jgi:hypothetical protein